MGAYIVAIIGRLREVQKELWEVIYICNSIMLHAGDEDCRLYSVQVHGHGEMMFFF